MTIQAAELREEALAKAKDAEDRANAAADAGQKQRWMQTARDWRKLAEMAASVKVR